MARFLVTGALPYSNGRLHVGHVAGAYLPADIYVRYLRLAGHEVRFICGSDDNGVAALKKAREEGRPVEQLTADYRDLQRTAFAGLGVAFDIYAGTHSFEPVDPARPDGEKIFELHNRVSQDFFRTIHEAGYFTKKKTRQLYDEQAAQFLPDRFVKGTCPKCGHAEAYGDQCENCGSSLDPLDLLKPVSTLTGTTPVVRETVHWYLRLSDLAPALRRWLASRKQDGADAPPAASAAGSPPAPAFPWRPTVVNFALGQLDQGLPERAMTRDLAWGVPVPLDDPDAAGKSLYVWFDAPIGYVSFTAVDCIRRGEGPDAFRRWWMDPDAHLVNFIGEDNIIFHALTWPAMLLATHGPAATVAGLDPAALPGGYQLAACVCANAYLNFQLTSGEVTKQSKSRGTAVFIDEYLRTFDPDPLRYYLTAIAPEGARTAFSWDDFYARNNNELVNALGNFVNRYQKILTEHFARQTPPAGALSAESTVLLANAATSAADVAACIERFEFKRGLERAMAFVRDCNVWINDRAPWNRVNLKKELPGKPVGQLDLPHAAETLHVCVQVTRTLGTILAPFLPFTAEKVRAMLNVPAAEWTWSSATAPLPAGHALTDAPLLFAKLDPKAMEA